MNTIGVRVTLSPSDPEYDAWASLVYGTNPNPTDEGFPLARVDNAHNLLAGTVFGVQAGTLIYVKVILHDPTTPMLEGEVLTGTASAVSTSTLTTQTLYVSPNGTGNSFTENAPGSLPDALTLAGPGVKILCLGGRYYFGDYAITASGSSSAAIQIEGKYGQNVIFDGADSVQYDWQQHPSDSALWSTVSTALNPNLVLADGVRLYPFQSLSPEPGLLQFSGDLTQGVITVGLDGTSLVSYPAEVDGFYRNPSSNPLLNSRWQYPRLLWVRFRDGSNPNEKDMEVSRWNHAFLLDNVSNIQFRRIKFTHYGVSPAGKAIWVKNSSGLVFNNCHFDVNDIGILLEGNSSHIIILDCEFNDAMPNWNAWRMKATYDNFAPYSEIFPYYSRMLERGGVIYEHGFTGNNITTRSCKFHDFGQAGHLGPPNIPDDFTGTSEIDFYSNEVYNCFEDGLELDGPALNVRVWGNTFYRCNAPISLAVAEQGPVLITRNIFHTFTADTFLTDVTQGKKIEPGRALKFQGYFPNQHTGPIYFFHNTVFARGTGRALDLDASDADGWSKFVSRNNLYVSENNYPLTAYLPDTAKLDLDYDGFYQPDGLVALVRESQNDSLPLSGQSALQTLSDQFGWETHGLVAYPVFRDTAQNDFYLKPNSPAINKGQYIPGLSYGNYYGSAPDLGRFEIIVVGSKELAPAMLHFQALPNVNNGTFRLLLPDLRVGDYELDVWNLDGRRVWTQTVTPGMQAAVPVQLAEPEGTYFVQCRGDGKIGVQKVIVLP